MLLKRFFGVLAGVALLALMIACLSAAYQMHAQEAALRAIAAQPDYDYLPEVRRLHSTGKLGEALELARFVAHNPGMPGQAEATKLVDAMEQQRTSLLARMKRFGHGFVFGSGDSPEELAGSVAADLVVWGDLRDLTQQGWFKVTGQETTRWWRRWPEWAW